MTPNNTLLIQYSNRPDLQVQKKSQKESRIVETIIKPENCAGIELEQSVSKFKINTVALTASTPT